MFQDDDMDIRSAASHCLGSISVGNVDFFFPKVLELISTDGHHKNLLLTSIKDIINERGSHELSQIDELLEILFANAVSEEESTRNIVAECLGRLWVANSTSVLF